MSRRSRALLSLLLPLLAAGCQEGAVETLSPDRPQFIVNGVPTGDTYSSVGAVLFDWQAPYDSITGDDLFCSGSLIAPDLFLTAAHCVLHPLLPPPPLAQFYVSFSPDLHDPSAVFIKADGYQADERFGMNPLEHDLAAVFLPSGSTVGLTPLQLPRQGYLDQLAAKGGVRGQLFVNVGYGTSATTTGRPSLSYDGKRKMSKSLFMALEPTWLGLLMNTKATGEGGVCYGDSGSPKFLDGNLDMVLAVTSWGGRYCRASQFSWRLDTPAARSFLDDFVDLP